MGELGRKGWKEISGGSVANTDYAGGYGQVGGGTYQSPGEKSSLMSPGNGYNREDNWSCSSQQGSKYLFFVTYILDFVFLKIYLNFRASSPNQNWNGSWGYQSDIQGYQSENTDYSFSSKQTSPQGDNNQVRRNSKKGKKKDEKKTDLINNVSGEEELWESLNN